MESRICAEDIHKLSYKQLKELAVQRKVNPKLKKAILLDILMNTKESTICEKTECNDESSTAGRVTRSRASIFKNFDNTLMTSFDTNKEETTHDTSPIMTKKNNKGKRGLKRIKRETIASKLSISKSKSGTPLSEITNTEALLNSEIHFNVNLNDKAASSTKDDGLNVENNRLTGNTILPGNEMKSEVEVVSNTAVSNTHSFANDVVPINASTTQDILPKRRGRKKKTVKSEVVNSEEQINLNNVKTEQGLIKDDTPVFELENVVGKESTQNNSYNIQKTKKGRRGKKENLTKSPDVENITDLSTEKSFNLNADKISTSPIENNFGETESSTRAVRCSSTDSVCTRLSPSGVREPLHLNVTGEVNKEMSKEKLKEDPSQSSSEVESMAGLPMIRGSTFVLDDKVADSEEIGVSSPKSPLRRSNTFIISNEDVKSPRQTFRFTESTQKVDPAKNVKKIEKSIGARILSSSKKFAGIRSAGKQQSQGSTVKKTISKPVPASGYKSKSGVARKAPNFKNIHKKLFNNMESLCDNKLRTLQRAQILTQSPVPKCAATVCTPKGEMKLTQKIESLIKNRKPPGINTPSQNSPLLLKSKTPAVDKKSQSTTAPKSTSFTRFGFKKSRKEVAKSIVSMKMPPISMEKKKEEDRAIIQGVRMNKRFLLQMKMRQQTQ